MFDVGANVGVWTQALADVVASVRPNLDPSRVRIFAFEPAQTSWAVLCERISHLGVQVRAERLALSESEGSRMLQIVSDTAGVNSFYPPHGLGVVRSEEVTVTTVDRFVSDAGIDHIDLVKVDAEGEDLAVIAGASRLIEAQAIDLIQFEYNHRWIGPRRFLKDAFDLLQGYGYELGKITRIGWEPYVRWHPLLENYRECNFLAISPRWRGELRRVKWWAGRYA